MLHWESMKVSHASPLKIAIIRLLPPLVSLGLATYALWELASSGIIPAKYIIGAVAVAALVAGLVLFLWYRWFATRPRRLTARIVAIILMLIILLGSLGGLYLLRRGLSTLDGLSDNANSVTVETNQSFNIFISGIDTYGDITTQSRSDVNIVATVNPLTHKILLTTAPRDSYVSIAEGGQDGMDKLTHAGIYGPTASMKTMARLLDTEIDAYVRINFTSFIESIDTLGGITISNPTAFTIDGEHFPVGELRLDGKRALLYSRERKSLSGGDVDRGKNQQRVIQGIVDEMTQIRSLGGFEALLGMIGSSVETNMSSGTIRGLINQQLASPSSWTTDSYTLTGKGQTGGLRSHAMPSAQLYMYVLDPASVQRASDQIDSHMDAKP